MRMTMANRNCILDQCVFVFFALVCICVWIAAVAGGGGGGGGLQFRTDEVNPHLFPLLNIMPAGFNYYNNQYDNNFLRNWQTC